MKKVLRFTVFIITFGVSLFVVWFLSFNEIDETSNLKIEKSETWKKILSFEDKNLISLNNEQSIELFNDFYRLVDKELYVGFGDSTLFTKLENEKNQIRYVLIGVDHIYGVNLYRRLSFQIFDKNGNHLNSREIENLSFSLDSIKIINSPEKGGRILEIYNKPVFPDNYALEKYGEVKFYALIGDDIQLVETRKIVE